MLSPSKEEIASMKRMATLGLLGVLLAGSAGQGSPVEPRLHGGERVPAFGSRTYVDTFTGGQRACVIVIGRGVSYLGLYVYDEHGNCVTRDEPVNFETRDDLAVTWYPPRTAAYTIEVRNLSRRINEFV